MQAAAGLTANDKYLQSIAGMNAVGDQLDSTIESQMTKIDWNKATGPGWISKRGGYGWVTWSASEKIENPDEYNGAWSAPNLTDCSKLCKAYLTRDKATPQAAVSDYAEAKRYAEMGVKAALGSDVGVRKSANAKPDDPEATAEYKKILEVTKLKMHRAELDVMYESLYSELDKARTLPEATLRPFTKQVETLEKAVQAGNAEVQEIKTSVPTVGEPETSASRAKPKNDALEGSEVQKIAAAERDALKKAGMTNPLDGFTHEGSFNAGTVNGKAKTQHERLAEAGNNPVA